MAYIKSYHGEILKANAIEHRGAPYYDVPQFITASDISMTERGTFPWLAEAEKNIEEI